MLGTAIRIKELYINRYASEVNIRVLRHFRHINLYASWVIHFMARN